MKANTFIRVFAEECRKRSENHLYRELVIVAGALDQGAADWALNRLRGLIDGVEDQKQKARAMKDYGLERYFNLAVVSLRACAALIREEAGRSTPAR